MGKKNIRISFIMITKDRPELAKKTIEDIEQIITSSDELILINGGSNNINHPLINKTIQEPDKSPGHGANKGIMIAEGKYIRVVSDDDTIRKKQLNDAIKIMDDNDSIDFLVCGGIRERENEIYPYFIPNGTNYGSDINDVAKYGACGQGFIIRTKSIALIGLAPIGLASDVEYVIQAISMGGNVKFCRINLFHHPIRKDSVTIKQKDKWQEDLVNIYKKYGIKTDQTNIIKKIIVKIVKFIFPKFYANRQNQYKIKTYEKDLLNTNSDLWDKGFS